MNIVGLLECHNVVDWCSKDWVFLTQTLGGSQQWWNHCSTIIGFRIYRPHEKYFNLAIINCGTLMICHSERISPWDPLIHFGVKNCISSLKSCEILYSWEWLQAKKRKKIVLKWESVWTTLHSTNGIKTSFQVSPVVPIKMQKSKIRRTLKIFGSWKASIWHLQLHIIHGLDDMIHVPLIGKKYLYLLLPKIQPQNTVFIPFPCTHIDVAYFSLCPRSRITISFAWPDGISLMIFGSCWWVATAVIIWISKRKSQVYVREKMWSWYISI